jgi:hypothetical protein
VSRAKARIAHATQLKSPAPKTSFSFSLISSTERSGEVSLKRHGYRFHVPMGKFMLLGPVGKSVDFSHQ